MMYDRAKLRELLDVAESAGLDCPADFRRAGIDDLAVYCNGIGADWMPDWLREAISGLNPTLVLAADIHDIRYALGGTESERKAADDEMLENGLKLANYRYGWYDPRRYWVRKQMRKFHAILREFGGWAWKYREAANGAS